MTDKRSESIELCHLPAQRNPTTSWRHRSGPAYETSWWTGSGSSWPCSPATKRPSMRSLDWEHLGMTWGDRPPTFFFKRKQKQNYRRDSLATRRNFKAEAIRTHKNIAQIISNWSSPWRGSRPEISCVNHTQSSHLIPRPFLIHRSLAIHSTQMQISIHREEKGKFKKTWLNLKRPALVCYFPRVPLHIYIFWLTSNRPAFDLT